MPLSQSYCVINHSPGHFFVGRRRDDSAGPLAAGEGAGRYSSGLEWPITEGDFAG